MLLPGDARGRVVEALGAVRLELAQRVEHAHGDAASKADAQRLVEVGVEADAAAVLADFARAELLELLGEEVFGAAGGGGEEGETLAMAPALRAGAWPRPGAGHLADRPISTSRGLAPSAGPTSPSRSMRSIIRAARL